MRGDWRLKKLCWRWKGPLVDPSQPSTGSVPLHQPVMKAQYLKVDVHRRETGPGLHLVLRGEILQETAQHLLAGKRLQTGDTVCNTMILHSIESARAIRYWLMRIIRTLLRLYKNINSQI